MTPSLILEPLISCARARSGVVVDRQRTSLSPALLTCLRTLGERGVSIGHHTANKEREGNEADQPHDKGHHNIDQTE